MVKDRGIVSSCLPKLNFVSSQEIRAAAASAAFYVTDRTYGVPKVGWRQQPVHPLGNPSSIWTSLSLLLAVSWLHLAFILVVFWLYLPVFWLYLPVFWLYLPVFCLYVNFICMFNLTGI